TYQYLEQFQNELRQWHSLRMQPKEHSNEAVSFAVSALEKDAEAGRHTDSAQLIETISLLRNSSQHPDLPPLDFGQRLAYGELGKPLLLNTEIGIKPLMTWSWSRAIRLGAAPLCLVLADHLREAVGTLPRTLSEAVEEYWQQGEFLAARKVAEEDS